MNLINQLKDYMNYSDDDIDRAAEYLQESKELLEACLGHLFTGSTLTHKVKSYLKRLEQGESTLQPGQACKFPWLGVTYFGSVAQPEETPNATLCAVSEYIDVKLTNTDHVWRVPSYLVDKA